MRITLNDEEHKPKTALDDDASIYSKRDERSAFEKLKSYKGKEKLSYFCTYFLKPIIIGIIVLALLTSLVYTIFFKTRLKSVCSLFVINSPFTLEAVEDIKTDLTELLVNDPGKEEVIVDDQFWFATDGYQSRMVFTTRIAAGEVNMLILDRGEFETQIGNSVICPLRDAIPAEMYDRLKDYHISVVPEYNEGNGEVVIGEEDVFGLDVTEFLKRMNKMEKVNTSYCLAFVYKAKNPSDNEKILKYMYPEVFE